MARYVDLRPFSDYGINLRDKAWWLDFIFGLCLGIFMVAVLFAIFFSQSWVEVSQIFVVPSATELVNGVFFIILSIFAFYLFESLWIWSFVLRNLAEGFVYLNRLNGRVPTIAALLISLVMFIFIQTDTPAVNMILVSNRFRAGILLALPFILTQRLGLTIGLALGWSIAQINIFGFPNTLPYQSTFAFISLMPTGPVRWTGGQAGIGTGLMAMVVLIMAGGMITLWEKWRTGKAVFDGSLAYYQPIDQTAEN